MTTTSVPAMPTPPPRPEPARPGVAPPFEPTRGAAVRWVAGVLRPSAGRLVLAVAASLAAELAAFGLMATAAWLIASAAGQPPLAALSVAIVAVRACAVSRGVFRYGERLASHDAALRALAELRTRVFAALVSLVPGGLPRVGRADLLTRVVSDVDAVQDLVVRVFVPVATAVLVSGAAIGFVTVMDPAAGVVLALGLAVTGILLPALAGAATRSSARRLAPARAELSARTVDVLQGAADLAVFGGAERALTAVQRADEDVARIERRHGLWAATINAVGVVVQVATTVAVTMMATTAAAEGTVGPVWVAVLALTTLASFEPVLPLAGVVTTYQRVASAAQRLYAVVSAPPPVSEPSGSPESARASSPAGTPGETVPELRVENLVVRYGPDRAPALDGVDLVVRPGDRVAVVGTSGSGKSTLLAALVRFVEPDSGRVLLGGVDTRDLPGDAVRRQLAGVLQDDHLFRTTLRENLLLGRPDADDPTLRTVLDRVGLLGWLDGLTDGLNTMLGESGATVSGGQRRRLALARVLLADPDIVLLDEPTEGLDMATADALVGDLLVAGQHRSVVLVSHRLEGLHAVDTVVVLDAGRIVQQGTHAELLAVDGPYRDLWWASRG